MEIHNRDVFPERSLAEQFAPIAPLVDNAIVDDAFRKHEAAAVVAKRAYHVRGRIGMLLVILSVLFTLAAAFVLPPDPKLLEPLSIGFILLGALGLTTQVQLLLSGKKKLWLLNRFSAERIRSIKFQAYQLAEVAISTEDLATRVAAFHTRALVKLSAEVNSGEAALVLFSPAEAVVRETAPDEPVNRNLSLAAREAYWELRLHYQKRFATAEIQALGSMQRIGYASADLLYVAGGVLTVAALLTKLKLPQSVVIGHWIDFLALASFICGLAQSIMENASLGETSKGRYETYVRDLEECAREMADDGSTFGQSVHRIERVILGELAQFSQAASHISYRL